MHIIVKQSGRTVNEFNFKSGPVYIGRQKDSQILLPDRTVSRHHAVIYTDQQQNWIIEDLDSTNKTYLNRKPVHKTRLSTGDRLRIADYTIEIDLESPGESADAVRLEDTLTKTTYAVDAADTSAPEPKKPITRKPDIAHGPAVNLPPKRIKDFLRATEAICRADTVDNVLDSLVTIVSTQFAANRTWAALRSQPTGPMTAQKGKKSDGMVIELSQLALKEQITKTIEKRQFLLYTEVPPGEQKNRIKSAIIAPILDLDGIFGVLYFDNDTAHAKYNLSDLDYAMLLSIHTATVLENF